MMRFEEGCVVASVRPDALGKCRRQLAAVDQTIISAKDRSRGAEDQDVTTAGAGGGGPGQPRVLFGGAKFEFDDVP
ncbi:hypothetical protein [Rhodococcus opacus]|nr:hypothetical protein [Rhodococcus opacus]